MYLKSLLNKSKKKRVYLDYFDELSETGSSLEEVGHPKTVGPSEMVRWLTHLYLCYDVLSARGESPTDMDFSAT